MITGTLPPNSQIFKEKVLVTALILVEDTLGLEEWLNVQNMFRNLCKNPQKSLHMFRASQKSWHPCSKNLIPVTVGRYVSVAQLK